MGNFPWVIRTVLYILQNSFIFNISKVWIFVSQIFFHLFLPFLYQKSRSSTISLYSLTLTSYLFFFKLLELQFCTLPPKVNYKVQVFCLKNISMLLNFPNFHLLGLFNKEEQNLRVKKEGKDQLYLSFTHMEINNKEQSLLWQYAIFKFELYFTCMHACKYFKSTIWPQVCLV